MGAAKFYVIFGNWSYSMSRIGKLPIKIPTGVDITCDGPKITVKGKFGTLHDTVPNVLGVEQNEGILGVGYRAAVQGKSIVLNLGYSHQVIMDIPEGISVEVAQNTKVNLKGCDKAALGLFAANIRTWRPPEPYKGKGIIYEGEIVKRKAGKSGK